MINKELIIKINIANPPGRLDLLTPSSSLRWGKCQFTINSESANKTDYYVVWYNANPVDHFYGAAENTLFIAGEPASIKVYPKLFYQQFANIIDTHSLSCHKSVRETALGLCWHAGLNLSTKCYDYGYDYLKSLEPPGKANKISVICSQKANTIGHRKRLAFIQQLKERLGDRIVHYGRGFEEVNDKLDVILPNRFHLVIENTHAANYWTKKLADSYLGWALPFYAGCPNLSDYFATDAFIPLDLNNVDDAVNRISHMLETKRTENELNSIRLARNLILDTFNPFAQSAYWARKLHVKNALEKHHTIRSHKAFQRFPNNIIYLARSR